MSPTEYTENVLRLKSNSYVIDAADPSMLLYGLGLVLNGAAVLDQIKKMLVYGRPLTLSPDQLRGINHLVNANPAARHASLYHLNPDVVHGVLGVLTEAGELADLLITAIGQQQPVDEAKLLDETGDVLWYIALKMSAVDKTLEEAMEKNIEKLKVRFPDKFDPERAINRDAEAEQKVFDFAQ